MELLSWNYFYENIKIFCNLVHLLKLNEINILKEKGKIYIYICTRLTTFTRKDTIMKTGGLVAADFAQNMSVNGLNFC